MSTTGRTFNWRGFWADVLSGTGRSLLELDGSREAEAAMTGLDSFEAARRRRRAEELAQRFDETPEQLLGEDSTAIGDDGNDMSESQPLGIVPETTSYRPAREQDLYGDLRDRDRMIALAAGLAPSIRAAPLSANPYDHPGLPIQLALGRRGYPPLTRRR